MSAFVLAFGMFLIALAGALFFVERRWPGKLAERLKTIFNRKGTL